MSDAVKAQKLAAARKKLKEFQQKTKKSPSLHAKQEQPAGEQQQPTESLTSSTCSSLNGRVSPQLLENVLPKIENETPNSNQREEFSEVQPAVLQVTSVTDEVGRSVPPSVVEPTQAVVVPESLVTTVNDSTQQENSNLVNRENEGSYGGDGKILEGESRYDLPIYNYFSDAGFDSAYNDRSNFFDNIGDGAESTDLLKQKLTNVSNDSEQSLYNTAVYLDNNLYSNPSFFKRESANEVAQSGDFRISDIYDNLGKNSITTENAREINNYLQNERNDYYNQKDDKQDNEMLQEITSWNKNQTQHPEPPQSNVESLMQLSSQIAQLIEPNSEYKVQSPVADLEKRNQQLAALLEQEHIKAEQLKVQLQTVNNQKSELEQQLTKLEQQSTSSLELEPLKEQLQQHIQTVGVLVAEKTELSAMLKQSQANVKQKTSECEELRGRLKTSRSRVADLEKEYKELKENQSTSGLSEKFERLSFEYQKARESNEELSQDVLELRQKLAITGEENAKLREEIQSLTSRLGLADIKIQQLTAGREFQTDNQLEQLTQEKLVLEKRICDLEGDLKNTVRDRDQANAQFQQHVQQLNQQLTSFANQLGEIGKDNEYLRNREKSLVAHIGELEKLIQNSQNEVVTPKVNGDLKKEVERLQAEVEKLERVRIEAEENFTRVSNERDMLLKDLEAKKESILQLEGIVERLQGNQPDVTKLLAQIESEKVAAARAVTQNAELKKQLQDIQDDFIKMSNDKLILTEQLTSEQHFSRDQKEKLHQAEHQLQMLAEAIEIKDKELTEIRAESEELQKRVLQQDQLTDRLRHYEARDNSSYSIQVELQQALQQIEGLKFENSKLKEELKILREDSKRNVGSNTSEVDNNSGEYKCDNPEHGRDVSDENFLNKEAAMKQLEEKFLKTMEDIANLTEEKQRLEHIVLQLQGETETIGEYIALYQHQRGILRQRALEKDEQLRQLTADREQMKNKLDQLNALVKQLVVSKGVVTSEILEQHQDLCEEHAKLQKEMNKTGTEAGLKQEKSTGDELQTAEKIIALVSEIKSSNLIQPCENFHPCPWCSGKLITV